MSIVGSVMAEAAEKLRARRDQLDAAVQRARTLIDEASAEQREIDKALQRIAPLTGDEWEPPLKPGERILAVLDGNAMTKDDFAEAMPDLDGRSLHGALTALVRRGRIERVEDDNGAHYVKAEG